MIPIQGALLQSCRWPEKPPDTAGQTLGQGVTEYGRVLHHAQPTQGHQRDAYQSTLA